MSRRYISREEAELIQQQEEAQREAALHAEVEDLYKRVPEWRKQETRLSELDAVIEHAKASGFQEGELRAIGGREWDSLRKAWIADGRPRTQTQQQERIERAAQQLRNSGRVKDAASAIERLLDAREGR